MKHKMSRKNYLTAEITRQPMTITIQSNGNQHIHHHYHLILTRYLYDFATVLLLFDISNNTTTLSAIITALSRSKRGKTLQLDKKHCCHRDKIS